MIKIEIDSHEVTVALNNLSRSVADMHSVFDSIGQAVEDNILLGFGWT